MLGLESVQYRARALWIALSLMGSTPNNKLGILSGIPPLVERFTYLNYRYLVAAFCRLSLFLRERLGVLGALNIGRCIKGYSEVLPLKRVSSESFTWQFSLEFFW
jgi:hypothetical protein